MWGGGVSYLLHISDIFYLFFNLFIMGVMTYTAYTDVKTRTATNTAWLLIGSCGLMLLLINGIQMYHLINIGFMFFVGLIIYLCGAGGADSKCIWVVSLAYPGSMLFLLLWLLIACVFNMVLVFLIPAWRKNSPFLLPLSISLLVLLAINI